MTTGICAAANLENNTHIIVKNEWYCYNAITEKQNSTDQEEVWILNGYPITTSMFVKIVTLKFLHKQKVLKVEKYGRQMPAVI